MNQAAYDPVAVLDELIEGYVPDSTVPVSILDSYITELLAQPGGARLLASHCEPASGHTLGTALVSHRNHRLQAGAAAPTDPNDRPYGARSLLVRLLDAGVDLARPNAHGRSALVAALCWHDRPQTLTDALRIAALQPTSEVLDRLYAAPNAPCDPLHLDPDGAGLASARLADESLAGVMRMGLGLSKTSLGHIDAALAGPGRHAAANRDWLDRALPAAAPRIRLELQRRRAFWHERALDQTLPAARGHERKRI